MFWLQLKNWGLILSLSVILLASPIAGWAAGGSCPMSQEAAATEENCCDQIIENHCPPESDSINQDSHHQRVAPNNFGTKIQNGCCCLTDKSSPENVLVRQKVEPTPPFYPTISPAQLGFPPVLQTTAIVSFKPNIVYPARSALSEIPPRAPPAL